MKSNEINLTSLYASDKVLNMYVFGSRLYGNNRQDSDYDVIVITTNDFGLDGETITWYNPEEKVNFDFSIYSEDSWIKKCENNHINALEIDAIQHSETMCNLKKRRLYSVPINLIKLRESISATVSNSWAKANKKLNVEKDFNSNIAKKSLWHCFRILMYGIQVAKYGKIVDFKEANYLYDEIVLNECNDWKFYKNKYQEKLNNMRTEFRTYMEDGWRDYKKVD